MTDALTVTELRQALQTLEREGKGDHPIIIAEDEEGNGYSPLWGIGEGGWDADEGELYGDDDDYNGPVQPAVVFWP